MCNKRAHSSGHEASEASEELQVTCGVEIEEEGGIRKAICGYTWPGIEYGEPPSCPYTFFEYVDAVRFGDLSRFLHIEAASKEWWFPTLDRGAGALLHFAVDHGKLDMVKFLVEKRKVEINQRDIARGWTPLHRCARVAHYRHAPFIAIFEYLLSVGANPSLVTYHNTNAVGSGCTPVELAVKKGNGWEEGAVREVLSGLIEKYQDTPKKEEYIYTGPSIGPEAAAVLSCWEAAPKLYPPKNWRPPPPAGFLNATGMRRHADDPWRPAGDRDGSCMLRPMTKVELDRQGQMC